MLCVVGDLVEDVVVHLSAQPARGTDTPARIVRTRGGSAANVAAAAAIDGGRARFIGRVGDDPAGVALTTSLASDGVDVRAQRAGRTGTIVVLVDPDGERTMLPDRAAAQQLGPVDPEWLDQVSWLHVPAYSLCAEPIGTITCELVRQARRGSVGLSVDVSSVAVVESFGVRPFCELLEMLAPDVVFATVAEGVLVDGLRLPLLVVKDGPRPIELRHADGRIDTVEVRPVAAVVDTTGAGDAFAGGWLAARLSGADPVAATRAGAALARRTLAAAGARPDAVAE